METPLPRTSKYCITRDAYRAKAFKAPRWPGADSTGDFAGKMYRTHKPQSLNKPSTCAEIIYRKHLYGRIGAMIGANLMDCVCKLLGGEDSQHHIVRECSHKDMLACRTKHVQLLKRRSSDMTTRSIPTAPYFQVYLDFALQAGEAVGAFTSWTGILDPRLISKLETVEEVHAVGGGVLMTALIKECRSLAACVRELHRTRHKLMQAMQNEEIRAITKVSAHRWPKKSHRKETVHANIRQYTVSQDSKQLQQA